MNILALRRALRSGYLKTVVAVVLLIVFLFPVYWMLNASVAPGGNALNVQWVPTNPDFSGYVIAIEEQGRNLLTSLTIAIGAAVLAVVVAAPCAYALAQFDVKGSGPILFVVLLSQMIPVIVVANALYGAYNSLGLLNSVLGLILANGTAGIPFAILIMRAYLLTFPKEIVEAARVDGCSHLRAFVSIVLPVSINAVITAGIFSFLFAWSDFLMALTLTTGERVRPITLGIYNYIGSNAVDWSAVMATAVIASVPAIVLIVGAQKYIAAGAAGGAVK